MYHAEELFNERSTEEARERERESKGREDCKERGKEKKGRDMQKT
jgi:hypothetical protein